MFTTKYSKSQPKKQAVKKYAEGGIVDALDEEIQPGYNAVSGANDLPITVRNRDGTKNVKETARVRVNNFIDSLEESGDRKHGLKRSARSRARKGGD